MQRENHSDIQRPNGRRSEARYGPGGSNTVRRKQELAARAAARNARRAPATRNSKAPARPIFTPARQRMITIALIGTSLVAGLGVLFGSPMTQVRNVRVAGVASLLAAEAEATRSAAVVEPGTNVFRLNLRAIEKRLAGLPWIASAKATRRFPDGVTVSVRPRTAHAHLQADGQNWEVDGAGYVIRPLRSGGSLPVIRCATAESLRAGRRADAAGLAAALKAVSECRLPATVRIAKVDIDRKGELCLNMSDTVAIRLGQQEALSTKIDYVQRIYDDRPDIGAEIESIDLRWPESPSCVLRGAGTSGPNERSPLHNRRDGTPRDGD